MQNLIRFGLGQDSHRFIKSGDKALVLGGYHIPDAPGLEGNSDADILLHSLCNAISSVTTIPILGAKADEMCKMGITDSAKYLEEAILTMDRAHNPSHKQFQIISIAFTIEASKPKLLKHIPAIRENIASLCDISADDVGITATTGEGLTDFGRGLGMQAFCIITVREEH